VAIGSRTRGEGKILEHVPTRILHFSECGNEEWQSGFHGSAGNSGNARPELARGVQEPAPSTRYGVYSKIQ
jgi:hypothetical protein